MKINTEDYWKAQVQEGFKRYIISKTGLPHMESRAREHAEESPHAKKVLETNRSRKHIKRGPENTST